MSGSNQKPKSDITTMSSAEYQAIAKSMNLLAPYLKIVCALFDWRSHLCDRPMHSAVFMTVFDMSTTEASNPTVAVLIILSVILTSFGVYDKIAQWAGAGSAVPVTGFANSMCSAALEHRAEGLVLGVGASMFKLAGSVIVFGTVAAFIIGIIYAIFGIEGGNER